MNWEFLVGQSLVLIIALCGAYWAISNRLVDEFKSVRKETAIEIAKMQMDLESRIDKCEKNFHETKGLVFARFDMHKVDADRVYVKKEVNDEKLSHLEEKMNMKLEGYMSLINNKLENIVNTITGKQQSNGG